MMGQIVPRFMDFDEGPIDIQCNPGIMEIVSPKSIVVQQ
jgi:hypothetical protein